VAFLLVTMELFLLGVMAEALVVKINWKSVFSKEWGQFGPNFRYKG